MLVEQLDGIPMYCFQWSYIDTNMYVFVENGSSLIIDPVWTPEVEQFLMEQTITDIIVILTHEHFDHVNGLNWLREHFSCKVYGNEICASHVCSETKNLSNQAGVIAFFNTDIRERNIMVTPFICHVDQIFRDRMELRWNYHELLLLTTPGHTEGSICIVFDNHYLFSGDTLLEIPTITRLPGGSKKRFQKITLPMLREICEDEMKVYPGHGSFGTFGEMMKQYETKE